MCIQEIFSEILKERKRQNELHPNDDHSYMEWAAILSEECGETVKELNNLQEKSSQDLSDVKTELIHTAAVCFRILEKAF